MCVCIIIGITSSQRPIQCILTQRIPTSLYPTWLTWFDFCVSWYLLADFCFSFTWVWMGVCLWRCTWVCAGYVCVGRSASGVVPQKPSTSFPIGMHQVGWRAGQWILGILLSPLLSMRTASVDHSTWLFMPVLGIEPRSSWYAVSSKPVEPSVQPHFFS